ncbi:hypothetical protein V6N13_054453 [Hibiscus sabdariffa]|uniref:Uncharacterized protein n=1 Tax=Hibiscus sabdariffa TaxID=183260 RepID=A0ABR2DZG2_9ROSI
MRLIGAAERAMHADAADDSKAQQCRIELEQASSFVLQSAHRIIQLGNKKSLCKVEHDVEGAGHGNPSTQWSRGIVRHRLGTPLDCDKNIENRSWSR